MGAVNIIVGVFVNLNEVVSLLKEIVDDCSSLEGTDFYVAPSKVKSSNVDGYEIHMTGEFNDEVRKYLNEIAITKKLAISQEPTSIGLYKSKQR